MHAAAPEWRRAAAHEADHGVSVPSEPSEAAYEAPFGQLHVRAPTESARAHGRPREGVCHSGAGPRSTPEVGSGLARVYASGLKREATGEPLRRPWAIGIA